MCVVLFFTLSVICLFSIIGGFVGHVMVDPFHCIYFDALSKLKFIIAYEMNWSAIWIWDGPKSIFCYFFSLSLSLFHEMLFKLLLCHSQNVFPLPRAKKIKNTKRGNLSISFSLSFSDVIIMRTHTHEYKWSLHEIKSEFMYRKMCAFWYYVNQIIRLWCSFSSLTPFAVLLNAFSY